MADGYAKVSGRPAFVNVHTIASAANALGQLVNASADGTPIVMSAGKIPVLFVVFNNQNYQSTRLGLIRHGGRAVATGRFPGTFIGDPDIDHAGIARGYGVDGERVTAL